MCGVFVLRLYLILLIIIMSTYKHQSGAAKRKRKLEQAEKVGKLKKIDSFFDVTAKLSAVSAHNNSNEKHPAVETDETSSCTAADTTSKNSKNEVPEGKNPVSATDVSFAFSLPPHNTTENNSVSGTSPAFSEEEITTDGCDKGRFGPELTCDQKRFIINSKPCRPMGPFPKDAKGKSFSQYFYTAVNKSGIKTERAWLCYSRILNKCYCQPCWLFSQKIENVFGDGYNDWSHLHQAIKRHESSTEHNACCAVYDRWRLNKTVDQEQEKLIREEVCFWRKILERVVNVILVLATSNLPFRGHNETHSSDNPGVFLSIINLLSIYDPILQNLLEHKTKKSVSYLSSQIQNEIIDLLGDTVKKKILDQIKKSPFFSIIIDTTQDITKIDQMSFVYRYVHVDHLEDKPSSITVRESFLGFIPVTNQTGQGLTSTIINSINDNGLDFGNLRGQGYDGAANMSGVYNGVQAQISSKTKNAPYVHCAAHNLNLVLNDSVKNIEELRKFYDVVERVYVFFAHSIKRWALLVQSYGNNGKITLKKLTPTRWSSRNDALRALRIRFCEILKSLSKIMLTSSAKPEMEEARNLRSKLESFEFIFLVVVETRILSTIDVASKHLQDKQQNIQDAAKLLDTAFSNLLLLRDSFAEIKSEAVLLAQAWGANTNFDVKRTRKTKFSFSDINNRNNIQTSEEWFKINVYYKTLDIVIFQLRNRLQGIAEISKTFKVLNTEILASACDSDLIEMGRNLCDKYDDDITDAICNQLVSFRQCFREELPKIKSPLQLLEFILIQNYSSSSSFTEIITACLIFLTIPVTVATCERSFSKLKLIKNYLRNSIGQDRLSALAMISIENSLAREVDLSTVIDAFANAKVRKKNMS